MRVAERNKQSFLLALIPFFSVLFCCGCATTDTEIVAPGEGYTPSGTQIEGEQTGVLSAASSPYWVTGDITVPAGASLVIEPGVELRFDGLYQMTILGRLQAVGTADQNIVFTSMDGAFGLGDFGQWRALIFDTGASEAAGDTSELAYCLIQFGAVWDSTARYPVYPDTVDSSGYWINAAVFCWHSSPVIRNCTIVRNGYHGIYCIGEDSDPLIVNNIIVENDGDGIRCESGSAPDSIKYNDVWKNHARNFAETPSGIGELVQLNANRDSCDFQYNISLDPLFADIETQDYDLGSCSPCITTGQGGEHIGSIPYYVGETELRGPIGGRTLSAALSPWYVSCDVFVEPGDSLIIESGVTLLFEDIYQMRIAGLLQAEGAVFMPEDSTDPGAKWLGILFTEEANSESFVRDCQFINASSALMEEPYGGALTLQGVSPEISGNTFEGSVYTAISCQYSAQPQISDNTIIGFGIAGIYCYNNSHPLIVHNLIRSGDGYGIWCNFFSAPQIESNLIYDTAYIGIKCHDQSDPTIEYNTLAKHDYAGLVCDVSSNPLVENNIIAFNGSPSTWDASAYANGIVALNSSQPVVHYNDIYQPEGQGQAFWGVTVDSSNLSVDPLFVDAGGGDFHLQDDSPCRYAAADSTQIGAYGLGDW